MKHLLFFILTLGVLPLLSQPKTPKDYGYRHLVASFEGTTVEALIKSKRGEDTIKKPLFFFLSR